MQNTGDEYLFFGPAILVSPVTTQGRDFSRTVYLPQDHVVRLLDRRKSKRAESA